MSDMHVLRGHDGMRPAMSLFRCEECGVIENTATSRYWFRAREQNGRAVCSQCDPRIGEWHGRFPREQYDPAQPQRVINPPKTDDGSP